MSDRRPLAGFVVATNLSSARRLLRESQAIGASLRERNLAIDHQSRLVAEESRFHKALLKVAEKEGIRPPSYLKYLRGKIAELNRKYVKIRKSIEKKEKL